MKQTKTEVNYRDGEGTRRCGNCTMYRSPSLCTAVQGNISTLKLCDLFKKRAPRS